MCSIDNANWYHSGLEWISFHVWYLDLGRLRGHHTLGHLGIREDFGQPRPSFPTTSTCVNPTDLRVWRECWGFWLRSRCNNRLPRLADIEVSPSCKYSQQRKCTEILQHWFCNFRNGIIKAGFPIYGISFPRATVEESVLPPYRTSYAHRLSPMEKAFLFIKSWNLSPQCARVSTTLTCSNEWRRAACLYDRRSVLAQTGSIRRTRSMHEQHRGKLTIDDRVTKLYYLWANHPLLKVTGCCEVG